MSPANYFGYPLFLSSSPPCRAWVFSSLSGREVEVDDFLCALQGFDYVSDLVLGRSSGSVFMRSFEGLVQ